MAISKEPLEYVLGKYDIDVVKIRNESYKEKKGVWWVHTLDGFKVLKKVSNSEETLKYIISAVYHLCNNGVKIPAINKTKDGSDYVKINDCCYVLSDAAKGKNPSYNIDKEFKIVSTELARFHKASKNFHPKEDTKPKIHLGKWIEEYSKRLEDMNNFYKRDLNNNQSGEIGEIILKEFPFFYKRGKEAILGLEGKEYKAWVEKVQKTGGLCHQDFAAGNLLLSPTGEVFVLDTDSLTVDIPARDIRKLLNKIMRKNGKWCQDILKSFIDTYQLTNPLSSSEWKVVKLDLMYPHLFLGAMNKFYYQRDKEWGYDKYLKKIKEICDFEKTLSPILDNFDSLIPDS
ncbi:MAG TPA: CotS family spore coat protein [Clostridium sp.]|nr:CotS family spore coat protein [Clostridium sp.]